MAVIKTVTASLIKTVLMDDFDVGVLVANHAKELAAIDPADIDELVDRFQQVKTYIGQAQEQRKQEAIDALKTVIGDTPFSSIEELLQAAMGGTVTPTATKAKKAKTSSNKTFIVVMDRKEYSVSNKHLPTSLVESEAYQKLIKARPEMADVDNLLREYSQDYQQTYPYNGHYEGEDFHINVRGPINATTGRLFDRYKKKYPNATLADFKELAKAEYAKRH